MATYTLLASPKQTNTWNPMLSEGSVTFKDVGYLYAKAFTPGSTTAGSPFLIVSTVGSYAGSGPALAGAAIDLITIEHPTSSTTLQRSVGFGALAPRPALHTVSGYGSVGSNPLEIVQNGAGGALYSSVTNNRNVFAMVVLPTL